MKTDESKNETPKQQLDIPVVSTRYCPDCETKVKHLGGMDTDWYGRLDYYKCKCCKEKFVSRDGGELDIAAP
jgi:transposase-like protein